jgi:Peptidase_C39 like family
MQNEQNKKNGIVVDLAFMLLTFPLRFLIGPKLMLVFAKFKLIVVVLSIIVIAGILALVVISNNQYQEQLDSIGKDSNYIKEGKLDPSLIGKVLDVPYFNQYLEPDGRNFPTIGWRMCGAASSTMIAAYYGKIKYSSESNLKKFMYQDNGLNLPSYCNLAGGTFGVTSLNTACGSSSIAGIEKYLDLVGLNSKNIPVSFNSIKNEIDLGRPIIFSTRSPYDHIAVIKGYTSDGRLIMNDPFKNTQDGLFNYNYSTNGRDAVYSLNYPSLNVLYIKSVYLKS